MSRRVTSRDDVVAVISLYKRGHELKHIAAQTGVNLRCVQKLVKRFKEEGEEDIPVPKPRSGRPRLISPRSLKVIARQVETSPSLTAREIKEKNPHLLSSVSVRCIQQALHDYLGFKSYRGQPKPLLTHKQKKSRIRFRKKYSVRDVETGRSVLGSDEAATFTVTGTGTNCGRVYCHPQIPHTDDPHLPQYTVKHPASLMVWACLLQLPWCCWGSYSNTSPKM